MSLRRLAIALALLHAAATTTRAAGYAINDQGSRALGQGLVGVAILEGPETLFYNPGAAEGMRGWNVELGATRLALDVRSVPEADGLSYESARDHFEIPHLYVARGGLGANRRWALGLSVNAPNGLATEWADEFPGRFVSRLADLQLVQLGAMASVRLPRGWSLGFGPTWSTGEVQLVRDVDLSIFRRGHSAEADLTGDGGAASWRLGARWRGAKGWRFGAMIQGETEVKFSGDVDYTVVPLGALSLDEAIATLFQDGPASTSLSMPLVAWVGFGHVGDRLAWELALTWTDWSVMDEVIVDLAAIEVGGQSLVVNEFLTPRWHDALAVRGGARYALSDKWSIAGGLTRDESPVPVETADPLLPDSDRWVISAGATRVAGRFSLDVGVQQVRFDGLDTAGTGNGFEAAYDSEALAISVSAGWRFGPR